MWFRRKKEEPEYIGECYTTMEENLYLWEWQKWTKFTKEEVKDEVNGYIKINEKWHKKDYVFHYSDVDIYASLRKKIEKKFDEKNMEG